MPPRHALAAIKVRTFLAMNARFHTEARPVPANDYRVRVKGEGEG